CDSVADAVRGLDLRRSLELLQLASKACDVRVERVFADERSVRPAGTDEIAPAHRLAGPGHQPGEQSELGRCQRHFGVPVTDGVANRIEAQPGELERTVSAASPQQRLQT